MQKDSKIYVAGHSGMVGSAIVRQLKKNGYANLLLRTHSQLDLLNQQAVNEWFLQEKPEYVFLAAAKVGGINANNRYRAQFIYENLQIQNNVIHASYLNKVIKLLFLGSSCIYPKNAPQPLKEEYLLTNELEYTNEPYAIAKIAGIKMCESYNLQYGTNYIATMPTNLYGENDNFDLENSHVLPAMIRKFYLAKLLDENNIDEIVRNLALNNDINLEQLYVLLAKYGITRVHNQTSIKLWGSGNAKREFLHVDDMADACLFIMSKVDFKDLCACAIEDTTTHVKDRYVYNMDRAIKNTHINIGCGVDLKISELADLVAKQIGYQNKIEFDYTMPDGTMQKLEDISKLKNLGWTANISLEDGIKRVINWYINHG